MKKNEENKIKNEEEISTHKRVGKLNQKLQEKKDSELREEE